MRRCVWGEVQLEEYLKQLQAEAKGVEERIAEMKKNGESQPT
jgi:hypothetical protein